MTEIYLIRHTQAEGNLYRMMQGQWDGDVTELGLKQIDALAERFKDIHIDAVYSSDLYRAWKTATAVTRYNGLEIIKRPALRELDMGAWETKYFGNVFHEYPEMLKTFLVDPESWKVEGSETCRDVVDRIYPELLELAKAHEGQSIAVVSHGLAIRCLLSALLDKPLSDRSLPICDNTAVSKFIYENGHFEPVYINDASHLKAVGVPEWHKTRDLRDEPFNPADDPDWYIDCYKDAWLFSKGSTKGFNADTYFGAALKHYAANPGSVMKILDRDTPVGLIDLDVERGEGDGYGWITLLYLIPEYRSKGYGMQLLSRAMFFYRRLGRGALRLTVNSSNTEAFDFYERNGFEQLEPADGNGVILMEKKLGGKIDVWTAGKD